MEWIREEKTKWKIETKKLYEVKQSKSSKNKNSTAGKS